MLRQSESLIVRQDSGYESTTAANPKHTRRNPNSSKLGSKPVYTRKGTSTPRWLCSICGRALSSPQQLLFNICLDGECQERQKQASRITRGELERRNTSARRASLHGDDLLVCCLVMCTYELLRDDTELGSWYFNSYFSHVSGLCQVIRNVDKSYEPSPAMQYAWREARLMAFRSAMFLRQPIFGLGRPPQWSSTTPSLKLSDDVLDNMFDLATWFPTVDKLMKRMDQMQHTAAQSAAVPRVVDRGIELARELMAWEERAMALYCNDRRPTLYSLCSTADGELLNVLTHHWMICMLLHSQLQLLVARCSLWHPHLKLPFWIDGWPYATFISVAGPLFSNPRFGIWSALASHTPMIATNFYFAANGHWHTSEARSLRNFVEDRNRPGNGLMRKFFYGLFARADVMIPQDGMVKAAQAWYGVRDSTPWKGADESRK